MPTPTNGPPGFAAKIAGQNFSEQDVQALSDLVTQRLVETHYRAFLNRRLQRPLGLIDKQVARIERIYRGVTR